MPPQHVPLTGSVLAWAIEDAGASLQQIADKVKVGEGKVLGWIKENEQPTTTQFRLLAKELGRPASFFFLPEPPATAPTRAEFRTFADSNREPGQETIKAIRLAQRVQKTISWVAERIDTSPPIIPNLSLRMNVEESAGVLRKWLGWTVAEQTASDGTDAKATKELRFALQERGVIVLNLTLDAEATRGFSLHGDLAPLIAVNTRDHHRARLFSYAHELVHLSLGSDAVCDTRTNSGVESFCNRVAAAMLMPAADFRAYARLRFGESLITDTAQVKTIRNHFRVSLRAAAIRAEHLGLARAGLFDLVDREAEQKPQGGRYIPGNERTRPRIRVDQYGHGFVNTLFDAEESGLLRRQQIQQILQVSDSELAAVKRLALSGIDA